jgi:hypothetical protein
MPRNTKSSLGPWKGELKEFFNIHLFCFKSTIIIKHFSFLLFFSNPLQLILQGEGLLRDIKG